MAGFAAIIGASASASQWLEKLCEAAAYRGAATCLLGENWAFASLQRLRTSLRSQIDPERITVLLGWPYRVIDGVSVPLDVSWLHARLFDDALLTQIYGQFLLMQLDRQTGEFMIARDALGGYPAHCMMLGDCIAIASDVQQLASISAEPIALNLASVRHMHQQHRLSWRTPELYHGVRLLPPGVMQRFAPDQPIVLRAPVRDAMLQGFATEQNLEATTAIARCQLALQQTCAQAFAEQVWLLTSGGMDSATLALSAKALGRELSIASAVFPGHAADESVAIKKLAAHLAVAPKLIDMSDKRASETYPALCQLSDYPLFPASFIGCGLGQHFAESGAWYVVDGNGGDELFEWHIASLAGASKGWRAAFFAWRMLFKLTKKQGWSAEIRSAARHLLKRCLTMSVATPSLSNVDLAKRMLGSSDDFSYYLAAEQSFAKLGLEHRSPFRDRYLIEQVLRLMPAASWLGGKRRALQALLCQVLSNGVICLKREQKVNFDAFATLVGSEEDMLLGRPEQRNFANQMPIFVQQKQQEGIALK
jgi:asparagine synthetase B (glutamine-hydrolysing)